MKVFLTGVTGYVGAAIAKELLAGGVAVDAFVRTEEKARAVQALGMTPVIGDLDGLEHHAESIGQADAIVHAGFDDARGMETDVRATRALLAAAARAQSRVRALVYTSNAYNLRTRGGEPVGESSSIEPYRDDPGAWRFDVEQEVLMAASDRVATSIVRLGLVYGGLGGTMPDLFAAAEAHGASFYIGEGQARASAIHRADAARLFDAVARARGRGVFHGVDGAPLSARALAAVIAKVTAAPDGIKSVRAEDAPAEFREHTREVLERDVAVRNTRALEVGWTPRFPTVMDGAREAYEAWKYEIGV